MAMSVSMLLSMRCVAVAAGFSVAVALSLSTLLSMRFVAVAAGFAIAVAVIMLMVVLTSTRFMPVGTGFTVFVTFCFGMAGVRHGGFLVRFVV